MTVGKMIELVAGKAGVFEGRQGEKNYSNHMIKYQRLIKNDDHCNMSIAGTDFLLTLDERLYLHTLYTSMCLLIILPHHDLFVLI